ncbi:MAG TPA: amino acid adenylation domain-containing protein, partial [Herpetosiphonaceae bacterium]
GTIPYESCDNNPAARILAEHTAYVIYTSGSTGQPTGVLVEQRQLANYVAGILDRLALSEPASFATVSTIAADLGNTAIFPCLCTGGSLHVIAQQRLADPRLLAEYMTEHPIDCLKIVPSHLAALLKSDQGAHVLPRKYLILGGEAARSSWITEIQQLAPTCTILNHYGPTEATVGVLTYHVAPGELPPTPTVPLGRPLANTQIYILNARLQPQPIGVEGEIYIGGDGVTRGYLNRPELTAERFVPDPFGQAPGSRLYRTGDLARYLGDGSIEFLGRIDHQIKVRGFRVEPGEIEATLLSHPAVAAAAVLLHEAETDEPQLVAYVVEEPRTGALWAKQEPNEQTNKRTNEQSTDQAVKTPPSPIADEAEARRGVGQGDKGGEGLISSLRQHLQHRLPAHMIPSAFAVLDALPLTPNGKLDRHALPAPDTSRRALPTDFVAPDTELERTIGEIWQAVLNVERVGIHDNFFDLGGHSLLLMQVQSQLQDRLSHQLSIVDLFEHPTVSSLARYLSRQNHDEQPAPHDDRRQASIATGKDRLKKLLGKGTEQRRRGKEIDDEFRS